MDLGVYEKKHLTVELDKETWEKLTRYCKKHRIKKRQLIREIIKQFLEFLEERGELE